MEARLKEGFGPLSFGSSQHDCMMHFGIPEEKEEIEGIDGSLNSVWHYWDKGFSVFFDKSRDDKFCCVEIDSSFPLVIYNQLVFGKREEEVIALLSTAGFVVSDSEQHEWGERRISFDDIFADFYFEKGKLVSVNYSDPVAEKEDSILFN